MESADGASWRDRATTVLLVFLIAFAGSAAVFTFWLQDLSVPQVAFLGSGNRLSLLVTDGPARLLLATGDSPIAFENAITRVRPLFARRIDVLLVAGSGETSVRSDGRTRRCACPHDNRSRAAT